jgi:hypothetical protein
MNMLYHVAVKDSNRHDAHAALRTKEAIELGNWKDGTEITIYYCHADDAKQAALPNWYLFDSKSLKATVNRKSRRGYILAKNTFDF